MEHFLKLPAAISATDLAIFDIFLHGGSLLAILIYFWRDWIHVLKELWHMIAKWTFDKHSLAAKLIIGTIPAILAGLAFGGAIGDNLRGLTSIALFLILIAIFYLYAEWKGKRNEGETVSLKKSLLIGVAQALALIPGVSRSGATIGTGMLMGIKREVAAKFSFMLGGIAILAANVYALFSLRNEAVLPHFNFTIIGFIASFLVSLGAISWLLKFLEKHTLRPFSFYLMLIGVLILMVF
jgi:undecaprenyl-diphosphatase